MRKHRLIPASAQKLLDEQDAARAKARELLPGETEKDASERRAKAFRDSFMAPIMYDLMMANKWGASASLEGNEVSVSIRAKYPPRKLTRFEQWLNKHFRNKQGIPVFQFEPRLKGFIFNEGGRGVTFTCTRNVRFRLYIAGKTFTISGGRLSIR